MNVELTVMRLQFYLRLFDEAGLGEPARAWLPDPDSFKVHPRNYQERWKVATMPAEGWYTLLKLLEREVFGPRGGFRKSVTPMQVTAVQEIAAAVNTRSRHPAITGRAVAGVMPDVVTAWVDESVGGILCPFYMHAECDPLVVLVPRYERGVTTWSVASEIPVGVDPRLGEPREHLQFLFDIASGHRVER